jgi:hypothetical protein
MARRCQVIQDRDRIIERFLQGWLPTRVGGKTSADALARQDSKSPETVGIGTFLPAKTHESEDSSAHLPQALVTPPCCASALFVVWNNHGQPG